MGRSRGVCGVVEHGDSRRGEQGQRKGKGRDEGEVFGSERNSGVRDWKTEGARRLHIDQSSFGGFDIGRIIGTVCFPLCELTI